MAKKCKSKGWQVVGCDQHGQLVPLTAQLFPKKGDAIGAVETGLVRVPNGLGIMFNEVFELVDVPEQTTA